MGRIYVCPVVGTGTEDAPQRAKAHDYLGQGVTRVRACIATMASGLSQHSWTICWVEADDWTLLDADPTLINVQEVLADRGVLEQTVPQGIKTRLKIGGIITQSESNSITTFRSALNIIVGKHYPGHQLEAALFGD